MDPGFGAGMHLMSRERMDARSDLARGDGCGHRHSGESRNPFLGQGLSPTLFGKVSNAILVRQAAVKTGLSKHEGWPWWSFRQWLLGQFFELLL